MSRMASTTRIERLGDAKRPITKGWRSLMRLMAVIDQQQAYDFTAELGFHYLQCKNAG